MLHYRAAALFKSPNRGIPSTRFVLNYKLFSTNGKIIYTETDEAPALATYSLLPIVKKYAAKGNLKMDEMLIYCTIYFYFLIPTAGITVEKSDISLAGRIIAQFPKYLTPEQRQSDSLAELGELCSKKDANIIKLPNISASIPQLNDAIIELRTKGYDIPMYVAKPTNDKERVILSRYSKVLGSAVVWYFLKRQIRLLD